MKYLLILTFTTCLLSCSKGGDSTTQQPSPTPTPTEANIAFGIDIDPGTNSIYAALANSQAIQINISSTLPKNGVTIDVITKNDLTNSVVSTSSISTSSSNNKLSIDNLQAGVLCTTTITVTSKTTASNFLIKSLKIAKK
jgi:hypothetical protein